MVDNALGVLPAVVRANLLPITALTAVGVYAIWTHATANSASGSGKSVLRAQRTLDELPKYNTDSKSARMVNRRISVAGESFNPETLVKGERVVHPKNDEARKSIARATKNSLLFRNLDHQQYNEIVDAMVERKVSAKEVVIKQGDEGDFFYVVDSGDFEIFVNGTKVAEAHAGGSFGELALLYGEPRAATVQAATPAVLWAVERTSFRRIVLGSNMVKRQRHDQFLKSIPLLDSLNPGERVKLVDALQPVSFDSGEQIVEQGESGEHFYIIEDGEADVFKVDNNGVNQKVGTLKQGDYFGEIALLTDGLRAATVVAKSNISLLVLDKPSFDRLLGPCTAILQRNMKTYQLYKKHLDH